MEFSKEQIKKELTEFAPYLKNFIRRPMTEVRKIPKLSLPSSLIFLGAASLISGFLSGLLMFSPFTAIFGGLFMPFAAGISSGLLTFFIYYFFYLFFSTELSLEKLFNLVVICSIPFLVFNIAAGVVPLVEIFAYAFSAMLLAVGLVENFGLPKKIVLRLVGGIFLALLLVWLINLLMFWGSMANTMRPSPLDQIERDYK